ncbi:MAG: hypothetical protein ACMXYF_04045 [Candidatus Woesearchaeota archaeon]
MHNFLLKGHHEDTPKENRPIYSDHMHSHNQPFHEMPSHPDPYSQNHSDEIEQKANKIRAQLLAAKQDLQKNCI